MGFVRDCPKCHHIHPGSTDPRFKPDSIVCQVPVRIPMPNQPGTVMAVPCGCDGKGPATPAPEPVVAPPMPTCFNPGCSEFAAPNSSFCSETCNTEMAALVANLAPSKGDTRGE